MRLAIFSFFLAASAFAQPALTAPQVGRIRDNNNTVRPVLGLAGSFIVGDAAESGVVSAAFSSNLGILKTDTALIAVDPQNQVLSTQDAPAGSALISFLALESTGAQPQALVYFPQSGALLRWSGSRFDSVPFDATQFAGDVLSLAVTAVDAATFLVQRDDGLWLVREDLSIGGINSTEPLPGISAPAFLLSDGSLLYLDSGSLILRRADRTESRHRLPIAAASFEQMADEWIHIREQNGGNPNQGREFAVRLTKGRERIYELPQLPQ
ncbi:MAG TPA: hypothetical protein VKV15_15635 [Bryobacteraceae bacterium]|nr:hypothetical protein [Bryobacteraceae bacterium]